MIYIGIAIVLFLIDFVVKGMVRKKYMSTSSDEWLKEEGEGTALVKMQPIYNKGAAMGALGERRNILKTITLVAVGVLSVAFGMVLKSGSVLERLGYALVNAGAWNNAYERLLRGKVTDYINFPRLFGKLKYIVFNLSDFFILIGGIILIIVEMCRKR